MPASSSPDSQLITYDLQGIVTNRATQEWSIPTRAALEDAAKSLGYCWIAWSSCRVMLATFRDILISEGGELSTHRVGHPAVHVRLRGQVYEWKPVSWVLMKLSSQVLKGYLAVRWHPAGIGMPYPIMLEPHHQTTNTLVLLANARQFLHFGAAVVEAMVTREWCMERLQLGDLADILTDKAVDMGYTVSKALASMTESLAAHMQGANAPAAIWDTLDDEGAEEHCYALPLELGDSVPGSVAYLQDRLTALRRVGDLGGLCVGAGWSPPFYLTVGDANVSDVPEERGHGSQYDRRRPDWFMLSDGTLKPYPEAAEIATARGEWVQQAVVQEVVQQVVQQVQAPGDWHEGILRSIQSPVTLI